MIIMHSLSNVSGRCQPQIVISTKARMQVNGLSSVYGDLAYNILSSIQQLRINEYIHLYQQNFQKYIQRYKQFMNR